MTATAGAGWEALLLGSEDYIREQAYLVARGVRPMAIVADCPAEPMTMLRAETILERLAGNGVLTFVIDRGDGHAHCGYAASGWAMDLLRWVAVDQAVPAVQRHRVVGLLLGYGPAQIGRFEEGLGGRMFAGPTGSDS